VGEERVPGRLRFFVHEATGGSDHIVFNNPSVAVPGIEFFSWPDQWYHADKDLPENADPTAMKRVAFIGAATAWVSAHLTDEMVPGPPGRRVGLRVPPGGGTGDPEGLGGLGPCCS
jgi:hypothetical protein